MQIKNEFPKYEYIGLYSEGFFRPKIKLDIQGIFEFFYGALQYFTNILTPVFSRLQMYTCKVKLSHAFDAITGPVNVI